MNARRANDLHTNCHVGASQRCLVTHSLFLSPPIHQQPRACSNDTMQAPRCCSTRGRPCCSSPSVSPQCAAAAIHVHRNAAHSTAGQQRLTGPGSYAQAPLIPGSPIENVTGLGTRTSCMCPLKCPDSSDDESRCFNRRGRYPHPLQDPRLCSAPPGSRGHAGPRPMPQGAPANRHLSLIRRRLPTSCSCTRKRARPSTSSALSTTHLSRI